MINLLDKKIYTGIAAVGLGGHVAKNYGREAYQAVIENKENIKKVVEKICSNKLTPYVAAGSLGALFGSRIGLSFYNSFIIGTITVPVIQGSKAILEGKTIEEAAKEVLNKPTTPYLFGLYATVIGSQIGVSPSKSFAMGASAIPIMHGVRNINKTIDKISSLIQAIKNIFIKAFQQLINGLIQTNKVFQRIFNKTHTQSHQQKPRSYFKLIPGAQLIIRSPSLFEVHIRNSPKKTELVSELD